MEKYGELLSVYDDWFYYTQYIKYSQDVEQGKIENGDANDFLSAFL